MKQWPTQEELCVENCNDKKARNRKAVIVEEININSASSKVDKSLTATKQPSLNSANVQSNF